MKAGNKFWDFMGRLADMVLLSFLWLLGSILIITIPLSTVAAYYTAAKCIRHQAGYVFREYWQAYKSNLKQGLLLGVIYGIIAAVLLGIRYYVSLVGIAKDNLGGVYYVFVIVAVLVLAAFSFYLFPVIARFRVTLFSALRLSIYLGSHNLPTMIPMLITFAGAVALVYLVPVSLVIVPGGYVYLMTKSVEKALRKYIRTLPDAADHEGMWYMEEE
ncbi:MAG: DUF624 domain-containing protein [Lachnospiraceae bacterium]|nr:DUF624 domain-containing protein [Lachnospiraceae bacterium]